MKQYEQKGYLTLEDIKIPSKKHLKKGVACIECIQEIPCNPCVDSCPVHAISMKNINAIPIVDYDACIGCGKCVSVCPGLAIFVLKIVDEKGLITLPYEFVPLPAVGEEVLALNRKGEVETTGIVKKINKRDNTTVITIEISKIYIMDVRNIRLQK